MNILLRRIFLLFIYIFSNHNILLAQSNLIQWTKEGDAYYQQEGGDIVMYNLPDNKKTLLVSKEKMIPAGQTTPINVRNFRLSEDQNKVLIYTNSKKVWRYQTRGDYWILNRKSGALRKLGINRPSSSLMFAKISPDGNKVAYVSERNIYVEDLSTNLVKQLTSTNQTAKLINGTFDWVYEEEFYCRDGFRWSPDSRSIAFWQIDANKTRDYLMLNTTDSIYSFVVPVEYPKVGEPPSPYKIGVINIAAGTTRWMAIPGDPRQTYLPRMEWAANGQEIIIQQLNRKQNESRIMLCNISTSVSKEIYNEADKAYIDVKGAWQHGDVTGWEWINNGKEFIWVSEKDGWRHIYRVARDGSREALITKGNYDIIELSAIDEKGGYCYFLASPENATQQYLYRTKLDGTGDLERVTPTELSGTHQYQLSPDARFAQHSFSNATTPPVKEWIALVGHKHLTSADAIGSRRRQASDNKVEFFKITTADNVQMDGWMIKPARFDSTKKYPVLFYVYGEPASQTVTDQYGSAGTSLFNGNMSEEGYIQISLDNRGTPAPKGSAWRKSIYRQIGRINIRDQAMGCTEILKWKFVDPQRIGVWGWSGGGSSTLNLLFQYPELYKTGVAIAAVGNQLSYDNIYQERYMGLPQENRDDFIKGSPITYAKNLKGNLLYIHGTGDDNVHFQNAELLINELIKHNKVFQLMIYPNRTHGISEGEGTSQHLSTMFTDFIRKNLPGGGR
jgi:dipeptidyl-peptidase 4